MVLYKDSKFVKVGDTTVYFDDAPVRTGDESVNYHGNSFITKNIALIVALRSLNSDRGCIVATTHLFWHPR